MGDSQPRRLEERLVRELLLAAALLALALVQTMLLPRPQGFSLDLLLLLVVMQALIASAPRAGRWALYGGVALDLCSGTLLGTHALALLVAVLAAALPLYRMSRDNWLLPILGTLFGAVGYYASYGLISMLLDGWVDLHTYVSVTALPKVAIMLVPALPCFLLWRAWLSRRRGEVPVDVY